MSFIPEFITFRRNRTSVSETKSNKEESIQHILDDTKNSLPNMSDDEESSYIKELKEKLEKLDIELQAAHEEVNKLNMENNSLKKTVEELTRKNELFKKVTTNCIKDSSPLKQKSKTSTPLKALKPRSKAKLSQEKNTTQGTHSIKSQEVHSKPSGKNQSKKKPQLCIISNNKRNKILQLSEESYFTDLQIIHYVTPTGGIKEMLLGLQSKLKQYTKSDYCVILIGETDFETTQNYLNLIYEIRNTVQQVDWTNIIICTPTYKCGPFSNMYNSRVETFNNLLYLDTQTHEYAWMLDSNTNLQYDYTMFSGPQYTINDSGIRIILGDIKQAINKLKQHLCENNNLEERSPRNQNELKSGEFFHV